MNQMIGTINCQKNQRCDEKLHLTDYWDIRPGKWIYHIRNAKPHLRVDDLSRDEETIHEQRCSEANHQANERFF